MQLSAPTQQACATEVGKVGVDAALSPIGLEGGLRWPVKPADGVENDAAPDHLSC
jgi:hypothetical protein